MLQRSLRASEIEAAQLLAFVLAPMADCGKVWARSPEDPGGVDIRQPLKRSGALC